MAREKKASKIDCLTVRGLLNLAAVGRVKWLTPEAYRLLLAGWVPPEALR